MLSVTLISEMEPLRVKIDHSVRESLIAYCQNTLSSLREICLLWEMKPRQSSQLIVLSE